MKFEKTISVRTPDGKDHPSVAAAEAHMKAKAAEVVAKATLEQIKGAITDTDSPVVEVGILRNAIRDIYLAAWPRAKKAVAK